MTDTPNIAIRCRNLKDAFEKERKYRKRLEQALRNIAIWAKCDASSEESREKAERAIRESQEKLSPDES